MTRVDPEGTAWIPYKAQVPYFYLKWYTGYRYVPVYSIYWLFGFIPIPYVSSWRRVSYSYALLKVGIRTVTRYRWVEAKLAGPKAGASGIWSTVTAKVPANVMQQLKRFNFPRPDYFSGAKAAAGAVYGRYTSDEKSNGLENAIYDFGSIGVPALALGSIANTVNDRRHGYISNSRLAWNVGATILGAVRFAPASAAAGFTDVMEHADENGWLDTVNGLMGTD